MNRHNLALCAALLSPCLTAGDPTPPVLSGLPLGTVQAIDGGILLNVSPGGSSAGGTNVGGFLIPTIAQRWTGGTSMTGMLPATAIDAISDNGLFALAALPSALNPQIDVPARWFQLTGWNELDPPALASPNPLEFQFRGRDMSASGNVIVGSYRASNSAPYEAFRWDAGNTSLLPRPILISRAAAKCVSDDGQTVGGSMGLDSFLDGTPLHQPCLWRADGSVVALLPLADTGSSLPISGRATVNDLDANASAAVGKDADGLPFVWRESEGITMLPGSTDGSIPVAQMNPLRVGNDGAFVFGSAGAFGDVWVWTPATGTLDLRKVLADLGIELPTTADDFDRLNDVSRDGSRLVGALYVSMAANKGLVIDLPPFDSFGGWEDLGNGLAAPLSPQPVLTGSGLQLAGTPTKVELQPHPASGLGYMVIGFSELSAPFKGGVLVPQVDLFKSFLSFANTKWTFGFDWPAGVPSDTSVWWQVWMTSTTAPKGFIATNALRSTTS